MQHLPRRTHLLGGQNEPHSWALQRGELCFDVVMDGSFTCFFLWKELCNVFSSGSLAKFSLEIAAIQQ